MNKYKTLALHYLPIAVPVALVVLQALIDNGYLSLSTHALGLVNALLVALGFGALHVRTK